MKIVLGLTGGSGCGKSVAADYLKSRGAFVIDADKIARKIMNPGEAAYRQVVACFKDITLPGGAIDRKKLGALVFSDEKELKKLNTITHSVIIREIETALAETDEPFVVIDAPLLFECGLERLCTASLSILASTKDRIRRIAARDGISEEIAVNRIHSQNNDQYYRSRSEFVIENNGSFTELYNSIDLILKELLS